MNTAKHGTQIHEEDGGELMEDIPADSFSDFVCPSVSQTTCS